MPIYMDVHHDVAVSPEELSALHLADLAAQDVFDVRYLKYWFSESTRKVFCLVDAPSAEAAIAVHRTSHGGLPQEIIEVAEHAMDAFLGDVPATPIGTALMPGSADIVLDTAFRTIVFTDMEGSTAATQRLGDEAHMEILRRHNAIIRDALARTGGREIKHTGDGIMASFVSPSKAVACALDIQRAFTEHNAIHGEQPIRVRIGISAGEPVADNQDLFGAAVQLAARACAHALPEQVVAANVVRELCIGKTFAFADQGEVALKGFDEPQRLFAVTMRG